MMSIPFLFLVLGSGWGSPPLTPGSLYGSAPVTQPALYRALVTMAAGEQDCCCCGSTGTKWGRGGVCGGLFYLRHVLQEVDLGEIAVVCVFLETHSGHSAVFCSRPQELLSQEGFPSEKVTNLEKSHFMSAILRCVPMQQQHTLYCLCELVYVCNTPLQGSEQQACLAKQN